MATQLKDERIKDEPQQQRKENLVQQQHDEAKDFKPFQPKRDGYSQVSYADSYAYASLMPIMSAASSAPYQVNSSSMPPHSTTKNLYAQSATPYMHPYAPQAHYAQPLSYVPAAGHASHYSHNALPSLDYSSAANMPSLSMPPVLPAILAQKQTKPSMMTLPDLTVPSGYFSSDRLTPTTQEPAKKLKISSTTSGEEAEGAEKPYKCPKATCRKSYKNANGLKYHLEHFSHSPNSPKKVHPPVEEEVVLKPFYCRIERCVKEYKNLVGFSFVLS